MLHLLNYIACGGATQTNLEATKHFLNYATCNPDAQIIYRKSDMILQGDSDAAYLVDTSSSVTKLEPTSMDPSWSLRRSIRM